MRGRSKERKREQTWTRDKERRDENKEKSGDDKRKQGEETRKGEQR